MSRAHREAEAEPLADLSHSSGENVRGLSRKGGWGEDDGHDSRSPVRVYTWCNRETSSPSTGSHKDIKQRLT